MAALDYADAIARDRLAAIAERIDGAATPGVLRLYSGARPTAGAIPGGGAALVATVILPRPLVDTLDGRTLTFAAIPDAMATITAHLTWARWENGDGAWCMDCDIGVGDPTDPPLDTDPPILIDSADVLPGGLVRVLIATLEE